MDIKDVEKLAELARIELKEDEKSTMLSDMQGILEYVKMIESIEIKDIEHEHNIHNVWREDTIQPREFSDELITKQFPDLQDGFLKVKKF